MPFINVKTNTAVSEKQAELVKSALGQAITAIPGKSEGWLMVEIEDQRRLFFKGTDAPAAMVQVSLFGNASSSALGSLTDKITGIVSGETGISSDRIYVSYMSTGDWGWNGSNF